MLASLRDNMYLQLLSVCCSLLTLTATLGHQHGAGVRVVIKEGNDVLLPCSLGTRNIADALFDWKEVAQRDHGQKEVFMYDEGRHYNNGRTGQSQEFRGRVSFFQDELKHGNASIVIRNTKTADSGNYSCAFPRLQTPQTFIELVVDATFEDRSGESPVAAPEPFVRTLDAGEKWSLLQCEVRGASPKPKVSWQDSDGNQLPAEEPQVSERGSSYDITLDITVTKTDRYRCVVEQEDLKHSITAETFVHISEKVCEDSSSKVAVGWLAFTFVLGVVMVLAVGALLVFFKCITIPLRNSPLQQGDDVENHLEAEEENGLNTQGNGLRRKINGVIYKQVNSSSEDPSA